MSTVFDLKPNEKLNHLMERLRSLASVAVAFSGGVDSAFLAKAAHDVLGEHCAAVTAVSPAFPQREQQAGEAFCREHGIRQIRFTAGETELEAYASNPKNRCYYCKRYLFQGIQTIAEKQHLNAVIEGSNLDDLGDYRPGMHSLRELGIISPLKEAGLTKQEIRELSRELGLPTWNNPSFACLASRVPYGERITVEKLNRIEQAEEQLHNLGFTQYRVRVHENLARIEVLPEQFPLLMEHRGDITEYFRHIGFDYVTMDLQGFRSGSMNEVLTQAEKRNSHGCT